jgi:pimeloyl-ACP methyl ester carboxylesterase
MRVVLFFGGNGHCAARLAPARAQAAKNGTFELVDVEYPGFEGRSRPHDLAAFLDGVAIEVDRVGAGRPITRAYATGIGALIALELRARGALDAPLVLQGPVLWGLESRWMPRLARAGLAPLLGHALQTPVFLRAVWRRHFLQPMPADRWRDLVDGYRRCAITDDLFRWLDRSFLASLREGLSRRPGALDRIEVWLGDRDGVVGEGEVRAAERALGVTWPSRIFSGWGHYPMLDDPEGWVRALGAK